MPAAKPKRQPRVVLLADLDERLPGIRFRMIDEQGRIRELSDRDHVQILCAISGG